MERRVLLAVILSMAVLYAYQAFLAPPPPKTTTASSPAPSSPGNAAQPAPAAAADVPAAVPAPRTTVGDATAREIVVETADVEAVLTNLASQSPQQLNWRTSIVDLMKLLNLDSSFQARKELVQELHYCGDMNDSAAMNIWLHKQVMQKLADNGGKVPDDLKS